MLARLAAIGMIGYGGLVLLEVVPHEAKLAGLVSLVLGIVVLAVSGRGRGGPSKRMARNDLREQIRAELGDQASPLQRRIVRALGVFALGGVLVYNHATGSGFALPELAIVAYGAALIVASFLLDRKVGPTRVGSLVAWSFPLALAPLAMYALNAVLSAEQGSNAATPVVHHLVVVPTALAMQLVGSPVELVGNNMVMSTPRGTLVLGVGLVCAGLYPMALFGGIVSLHAWQNRIGVRRFLAYLGTGLAGLWVLNVVRLVILAHVGRRWGAMQLQTTHAHLGWVLFAVFMVVFWAIVLRKIEQPAKPVPVEAGE